MVSVFYQFFPKSLGILYTESQKKINNNKSSATA